MQHIITDEEADRFWEVYCKSPGAGLDGRKAALTDFLNNRPESTLGKLRPIAEMPETIPNGHIRVWANKWGDGEWRAGYGRARNDTHFIDIQLPTPEPEAEERQRFEEAMKKEGIYHLLGCGSFNGKEYENQRALDCFFIWKLAKAK